jgi:hypothetical protein
VGLEESLARPGVDLDVRVDLAGKENARRFVPAGIDFSWLFLLFQIRWGSTQLVFHIFR